MGKVDVRWTDLMIDIETLANKRGAVVTQIGAVFFNRLKGGIGPQRLWNLSVEAQMAAGFTMSADTVMWWMRQSTDARMSWAGEEAAMSALLPSEAMQALVAFWWENATGGCKVWANSPSFDLVILDALWERTRVKAPWTFRDELDVRTLKLICPNAEWPKPEVAHRADDDAKAQAKFVQNAFRMLGPGAFVVEGDRTKVAPGPSATAGNEQGMPDAAAGKEA